MEFIVLVHCNSLSTANENLSTVYPKPLNAFKPSFRPHITYVQCFDIVQHEYTFDVTVW